ncbi:MAG: hypothetical protein IKE65_00035 [Clostridia bacterium]|nr:hypothetical protein [Clostridia bacterium]
MFEIFRRRAPKKPQASSQYPLFTAKCRMGVTPLRAENVQVDTASMRDVSLSILTNGNLIIYDENAGKVYDFFAVREIRDAKREDTPDAAAHEVVLVTSRKNIHFFFSSHEEKNIFWTVFQYVRNREA